ncbi:MAG TPA: LuxR C-terminal-related transcriptional regulator [Micromonospora sp.]|nr:LuxR C-terminal-related transcriptional regulator [Micromonospora sp.]
MELVEREALSASLRDFQSAAAGGRGCMIFVSGEAGIGKTSLVNSFCAGLPSGTAVHFGHCDSLDTPRPLGPLFDIARTTSDGLGRLLTTGADRHTIFTVFLTLLAARTSVVVVEDAHWADEATVDLLLFVGRRVGDLPAMVVVTYRDEEVGREHPLRRILGDLATVRSVRRLPLPPLSRAAVAALAEPLGRDGDRLYEVSGGNPFFVTEALDTPEHHVPATVRDAVLARAARLGPAPRRMLDIVAMVPDRAEVALLRAAADVNATALDDCVQAGMLIVDETHVRFRHELARMAIEADVPATHRIELHARILEYLGRAASADPARLSYHAEAAADPAAVLRYAPAAAQRAASLGAHREAAAHYARALRHASGASPSQAAGLWARRAEECSLTGQLTEAIDASARAIELWRAAGNVERQGTAMARRSALLWNFGRNHEAHETARAAVALLEKLPPGPDLAQAYTELAYLLMLARDITGAIEIGSTAIEYAERYAAEVVLARALNAVGSAYWFADPDRAVDTLVRSLAAARRVGDDQAVAAAMCNLGSGAGEIRRYRIAERWLAETVDWCTERDLDTLRGYALAWLARVQLEQARWSEATVTATEVVNADPQHMPTRIVALTVLGRLRARRGDPDAHAPLEDAWTLAEQTGDLQRLWPTAAARAELAWLNGTPERIEELVGDTYRLAVRLGQEWATGELGHWLWIADNKVRVPAVAARPYALQIAGDWQLAAQIWRQLGCPYEAALVLAAGDDTDQQLAALHELHRLGAWPAAELVARRLREHGVRRLPRQPRRATRDNPAHLTARELEVLRLLPQGLRNVDIAARLHLSPKTVDHHVSAILAKLGVSSRQEAARWARKAPGGVFKDGETPEAT